MKKCILIFISLVFILSFTYCGFSPEPPKSVTIEGQEYKRAFVGDLYPINEDYTFASDSLKISGVSYHKYLEAPYEIYIAYDGNGEPNIYFESEKFSEAVAYYKDAENFNFYCLLGNVHDEDDQQVFLLEEIDCRMFDSLIEFSKENDYNPFASFSDEKSLREVPIENPDNWIDDEIHFYKESKDGSLGTMKYTFVVHENKLCLLYQYDFSNEDAPVMSIQDVPEELSDYFLSLEVFK